MTKRKPQNKQEDDPSFLVIVDAVNEALSILRGPYVVTYSPKYDPKQKRCMSGTARCEHGGHATVSGAARCAKALQALLDSDESGRKHGSISISLRPAVLWRSPRRGFRATGD